MSLVPRTPGSSRRALVDGARDGLWAKELLDRTDLAAPHLMPLEAANILRRAALAGEVSQDVAALAYADLLGLGVTLSLYFPWPNELGTARERDGVLSRFMLA